MSPPSPRFLIEAIFGNSSLLVEKHLDEGADPNANLAEYIPILDDILEYSDDDDEDEDDSGSVPNEHKVAISTVQRDQSPSPLHLAVINCYHRSNTLTRDREAPAIVRSLLKHGADPTVVTTNLVVPNVEGYRWVHFHQSQNKTASGLALFLKQYPWELYETETNVALDKVIEILEGSCSTRLQQRQPHIQILKATAEMYDKLLFSEDFSDIRFVCSDGIELPAHRNVLAASSDYFKSALQGPWSESTNNNHNSNNNNNNNNHMGQWRTSHPSKIMKAVLTFIYSGRIQNDLQKLEPLELFAVAAEYDIVPLQVIAENKCITSLQCDNVKTILQAANLHHNKSLKKACFSFVRNNAARVLTNPDMINLSVEDPKLWAELATAIAPPVTSGSAKKRARSS